MTPQPAESAAEGTERVIFASASVGAGHNQAALAVMAALADEAPSAPTEFVDALAHVPEWFRLAYGGAYNVTVAHFPLAYGVGYWLADLPTGADRSPPERLRLALEWRANRWFRQYVLDHRPALVLATHHLVMPVVSRLIGEGADGLRMWGVITDHEAHRYWYAENVERYFVADEGVPEEMRHWQVPPDRITVSGIPIHPKWTTPLDRERILREWRLPSDRPIVLISGGTYFTVGPVARTARRVAAATGAAVVVLTGSNKKLAAQIASMPCPEGSVRAVPFTDRLHELGEIASIMVTKAGGLTTSECIAKGLPMVLTRSVPGQEAANVAMLTRAGAAVYAPTPRRVARAVADLLADADHLANLRRNARALYRPAAQTIAAAIAGAVR